MRTFFQDKHNQEKIAIILNLFLMIKLQLLLPCISQPFDSDAGKFLILHSQYRNGHITSAQNFLKKLVFVFKLKKLWKFTIIPQNTSCYQNNQIKCNFKSK